MNPSGPPPMPFPPGGPSMVPPAPMMGAPAMYPPAPMPAPIGMPLVPAPREPMAPPPTEPNKTLYVRRLNERINHKTLLKNLEAVFSQYGEIVEVRAKRNVKLRGQAFITFKTLESAQKAKQELHAFPLFQRPMDIQFARTPHYTTVLQEGGSIEELKQRREQMKLEREKEAQKIKTEIIEEQLPPNSLLFVENFPEGTTSEIVTDLFKQFPGFKEVRMLTRKGEPIAFVEYENEFFATEAKVRLHGCKITETHEIKVTYAKK
ncbi:uncharacterized protein BJ171DRAFT_492181 [Polychytrium aggregatum]|uniref:uncharacterized protein n=1 Tax=Polychytrium aggregatum TaxID=110093 RepID=UPI0022FE9B44|nr:uncharacterized protein BJ171DRAFT_492181 [Polychytrium aggregatum]KAI9207946.1 hypothetical protein BJ171DRAFT_492181 [Polychytrium aggregatum]